MADSLTSLLSGGLLDTRAPNYAGFAKKSEARRQGLINLGLQQIGAIFGGGSAPFYSAANTGENRFDPKSTYFSLNKRGQFAPYWAPGTGTRPSGQFDPGVGTMIFKTAPGSPWAFGKGLFGKDKSPRSIARRSFNRGQLFTAPETRTFEGFQEPFFEKRAQDYVNFAMPQLGQQYRNTRDAITFGLANRGLSESSQARRAMSDLERETAEGRQQIADTGLAQANQLRQDIEASRAEATRQLYQSADPAQALQSAVRGAISAGRPSVFQPISNMFTDLAQQYATQQLLNNYRQPFYPTQQEEENFLAPI